MSFTGRSSSRQLIHPAADAARFADGRNSLELFAFVRHNILLPPLPGLGKEIRFEPPIGTTAFYAFYHPEARSDELAYFPGLQRGDSERRQQFCRPRSEERRGDGECHRLAGPRSGNFADVYQFKGGDGKTWALKCFTRKVAGLQERYAKIDEHIGKANFPFTVGFNYFAEGIRIHGQWFPLLKMEWVEGFTLNEFVRDNAGKPQYLHALMQMWAKLTARLRDGNFAHADLQHGNVLLVPGDSQNKLGLKLIDYDGMWVPALADQHSGEIGHPNFQHPLRLKDRLYNADVDRFPHLVIACALRATLLGGRALWDKFDNGDNLLFKEADLRDPGKAQVFKTLWDLNDDVLCALVGKMALASKEPMRQDALARRSAF